MSFCFAPLLRVNEADAQQHSVDFFQAICNMTSGVMLPLTTADLLAMTIVGSVLENMDMERLIGGKLTKWFRFRSLTACVRRDRC